MTTSGDTSAIRASCCIQRASRRLWLVARLLTALYNRLLAPSCAGSRQLQPVAGRTQILLRQAPCALAADPPRRGGWVSIANTRSITSDLSNKIARRTHMERAQRGSCMNSCTQHAAAYIGVVRERVNGRRRPMDYLISTSAPAPLSFSATSSASALDTSSLIGLGAPSTKSLASLRPRPVISRTALMV